jgi:hypothetical protein
LARPDVPVFPRVAVAHLGLRLPFRGVADSHPDAASLWDAGLDVARRACLDMEDAIPEVRRGRLDHLVWAAGKLADREPRPADAVLAHPGFALAENPAHLALIVLEERWALVRAAAELYKPDEVLSAA